MKLSFHHFLNKNRCVSTKGIFDDIDDFGIWYIYTFMIIIWRISKYTQLRSHH